MVEVHKILMISYVPPEQRERVGKCARFALKNIADCSTAKKEHEKRKALIQAINSIRAVREDLFRFLWTPEFAVKGPKCEELLKTLEQCQNELEDLLNTL